MGQRTAIHEQVLSAQTAEDSNRVYGEWASSDDYGLVNRSNDQAPPCNR